MDTLIQILHTAGDLSLDYVWIPVILWTAVAFPLTLILQRTEAIAPVIQYHSRVALLLALPLGIAGSYLVEEIGQALTASSAAPAKFFVLQNPLTISAAGIQPGREAFLTDPAFWIGVTGILLAAGIIFHLAKILTHFIQLKLLDKQLSFTRLNDLKNKHTALAGSKNRELNPLVAFSEESHIPFTYGFLHAKIVIPAVLKVHPEKLKMALHHELMHISHKDFLLNGLLVTVKALFWFHPLVHRLYRQEQEYREITCDGQVLADSQFSRKRYAALLLEIAGRDCRNSPLAMSMAVNPSSLKKRIQIMASQNISPTTFRSSFLLTLFAASLLVLTISCSDITDEDGITNSEFQQAQSQMVKQPQNNIPLYIINGKQVKNTESNTVKLARIKSKYIKSVEVLKGEKAVEAYGQAGKNGVIKIQFIDGIDEETVYADLKEKPDASSAVPPPPPAPKEDFYVAVEKMPELKGGLRSLMTQLNYPEEAAKAGIEGRVIVSFIVDKQGNVEDPQIMQGVDESLDQEALRVVEQARFEPGTQKGKPVRVQYSLPITFKLPDGSSSNGS